MNQAATRHASIDRRGEKANRRSTPSPRTRGWALALLSLALLGLGGMGPAPVVGADEPELPPPPPNIVFVLTDDLSAIDLPYLPIINSRLVAEGLSFDNYIVSNALCCPSRATTLRGQYAHNTGIRTNTPPLGGYEVVRARGLEDATIATSLDAAGYRTGLMGRYLSGYPAGVGNTFIPPGWDDFVVAVDGVNSMYDYTLNENGSLVSYGNQPDDYHTDVLFSKADDFVRTSGVGADPFFLYLAPYAPHDPAVPALRHAGSMGTTPRPRPPSFDEQDMSDKPAWLQALPPVSAARQTAADTRFRARIEALQAVDEGVGRLIDSLTEIGELDNTMIVFTSDNGYHDGEHRLSNGKQTAFEEDIRVPMVIRGPGVAVGARADALVGNVDLAPTFQAWAGATDHGFEDGRSLVPLLDSSLPSNWRAVFLVEHWSNPSCPASPGCNVPDLRGLRGPQNTFVEYPGTGEQELYDLLADPFQLDNLVTSTSPAVLDELAAWAAALSGCQGSACRLLESGNVSVALADPTVVEGSAGSVTVASVPIRLSTPLLDEVTVNWTLESASAEIGLDVAASGGVATFPAGSTEQLIAFDVIGDDLHEARETVRVRLADPVNAMVSDASELVTIADDDPMPIVTATGTTSSEGSGGVRVNVALSSPSGLPVSVTWETPGTGTASIGLDYPAATGLLTFAPGETTKAIDVALIDDTLDELTESIFVRLRSPLGASITAPWAASMVLDDDGPPSLSLSNGSAIEHQGVISFSASLSAPSGRVATAVWETWPMGGSAAPGADYVASTGLVTFLPGQTVATVDVPLVDDATREGRETFLVRLITPNGVAIVDPWGIGTVDDDDTPIVAITDAAAAEGAGVLSFTVGRSAPTSETSTVQWATWTTGSATSGTDYLAASGVVTFAPGEVIQTIDVSLLDDATIESSEAFYVRLSGAVTATIGQAWGRGVIGDDDFNPTISISDASASEPGGTASFTVTLAAPAAAAVQVSWETGPWGTATANSDYTFATDLITFAPGETSHTVDIEILDDATIEPVEAFYLRLFAPIGATFADAVGRSTIASDDL